MALLFGVPRRRVTLRLRRLWFGVNGLITLDVPAEAEAHGRQHPFPECVLLPRAEPCIERRGEHVRRNRFLDRGLDGPATLAGILDEAGETLQLWILRQRGGAEIEQPGRNYAAAPPNLRDIQHIQRKALVLGQILRVLVTQNVEALGVGLHQSVLDAVMHHLDEMPGAARAGVNVAALGAGIAFLVARCARDVAQTGGERREDRVEAIHSLLLAADHHAVTALYAPDAAGRAAIDVANALPG